MPRENKSKYAILGILSLGPMTGYEIRKTIEHSLANFWNESYGQIYPILRSLVAEGLATTEMEVQIGKPNRHIHTITESGRAELKRWLAKPVESEVGRVEILLKLFFGWQMSSQENLHKLEEFRDLQQHVLAKYAGIADWLRRDYSDHPGLPYWLMTLSYGQHVSRALLGWCDESLEKLKSFEESHSA